MTAAEEYAAKFLSGRDVEVNHYLDIEAAFHAGEKHQLSKMPSEANVNFMNKEIGVDLIIHDDRLNDIKGGLLVPAKAGDAGMDVRACLSGPVVIQPLETKLIPLGFAIHIGDPNFAAILLPRSGQGHKDGIVLGNLVGLIDSEYQGQVYASIWNRNHNGSITIEPLQKIAQLVFIPIPKVNFNIVSKFAIKSDRGVGGFGSTGCHAIDHNNI